MNMRKSATLPFNGGPFADCIVCVAGLIMVEKSARRGSAVIESWVNRLSLGAGDEFRIDLRFSAYGQLPLKDANSISIDGLPRWAFDVLMGLSGGSIAKWLISPCVDAKYVPQAWVNDNVVTLDDGKTTFDALPQVMRAFPTPEKFVQQEGAREWDVLAEGLPEHSHHDGPFEVYMDATRVAILAAIYAQDRNVLLQALQRGADALDGLSAKHWDALRSAVNVLSQSVDSEQQHEHEFALPLAVLSRAQDVQGVSPEDARRALLALARDPQRFAQAWAKARPASAAACDSSDVLIERGVWRQRG